MAKASRPFWEQFELDYYRRLSPHRATKRWLAVVAAIVPVGWITLAAVRDDPTMYDSGPITGAHALIANDCYKCHAAPWRGLIKLAGVQSADRAMNEACLSCHSRSISHNSQFKAHHFGAEAVDSECCTPSCLS